MAELNKDTRLKILKILNGELSEALYNFKRSPSPVTKFEVEIHLKILSDFMKQVKPEGMAGYKNNVPPKFHKILYTGIYKGQFYGGERSGEFNNIANDILKAKNDRAAYNYNKTKREALEIIAAAIAKNVKILKPDFITTVTNGDDARANRKNVNLGKLVLAEVSKLSGVPVFHNDRLLLNNHICIIDGVLYTGTAANQKANHLIKVFKPLKISLVVYAKSNYYNIK